MNNKLELIGDNLDLTVSSLEELYKDIYSTGVIELRMIINTSDVNKVISFIEEIKKDKDEWDLLDVELNVKVEEMNENPLFVEYAGNPQEIVLSDAIEDSLTKLAVMITDLNITEGKWKQIKDIQDEICSNSKTPLEELRRIWNIKWKLKIREFKSMILI
jgi:hypothetical protein